MAERENLPAKLVARELTASTEKRGGLVGRGLAAFFWMKNQPLSFADEGDAERLFRQGMRYLHDDSAQEDYEKAHPYLTKASKLDHVEAQFNLAALLPLVNGEDTDLDSNYWLKRSAELGFGPALRLLWMNPDLLELDLSEDALEEKLDDLFLKAYEWYESRAIAGDAERQFELAEMLLGGAARRTHRKEGHYWLKASAAQDYRPACRRLGGEYLRTRITEHTTTQGIYWLSRAADLGDIPACRTLGELYLLGHTGGMSAARQGYLPPCRITPDKQAAIAWYERSIAMGDRSTAYKLGALYLNGEHIDQDSHLAEKWLLHAAMEGYDSAKIELGVEYSSGLRLRQDADAAIHWLEQSENRAAGLRLAEIYLEGEIISQNFEAAIKWLTHATDADRPGNQAMKILAKNCFDGRFSTDEESAAQAWLLQMAAKAHELVADMEDSQYPRLNTFHLAELYELGLGVPQDMERAISWYKQSAELGSDGAKTRLRKLGIDWETT